ncbi:MAG: sodium:solute symporter [Candidatus Azobacteroides sp.]|nr:sodium:solute symporter [Candidatus Azobacteroides sp.]
MGSSVIFFVLVLYFVMLLVIAHFTGKNSNNDSFFLGNRKSKWYVVAFGMIGSSISGVTFVSVPGMVRSIDMNYMQTVFGFFFGYLIIAHVLLPLYYKLHLTSIYTYLDKRFGKSAYKTGACFFLLSRIIGSAARLYIVVLILQSYFFDQYNIPFLVTTIIIIGLIWAYTFKSGVKTIIWTDALQTFFLLGSLILIIWQVASALYPDVGSVIQALKTDEHAKIFVFDDWQSKQNFFKQFISGIFITIVMTGLDQDMMQKNLSCRTLKDAQKNMHWYGFSFIPVNFLFLCLGILLLIFASQKGIQLPEIGDKILPMIATDGYLGNIVIILFMIGITAASFSSADSALTALTTSFCIDILNIGKYTPKRSKRIRMQTHFWISTAFVVIIFIFKSAGNQSIIDAIYMVASYTYGPLLGLFAFGLFTKTRIKDKPVPYICIASPVICFIADRLVFYYTEYKFGYEILMINGIITMLGLWCFSVKEPGGKKLRVKN